MGYLVVLGLYRGCVGGVLGVCRGVGLFLLCRGRLRCICHPALRVLLRWRGVALVLHLAEHLRVRQPTCEDVLEDVAIDSDGLTDLVAHHRDEAGKADVRHPGQAVQAWDDGPHTVQCDEAREADRDHRKVGHIVGGAGAAQGLARVEGTGEGGIGFGLVAVGEGWEGSCCCLEGSSGAGGSPQGVA